MTVATFVRVIEEVSRIDSAAGWCLAVGATYGRLAGSLCRQARPRGFALITVWFRLIEVEDCQSAPLPPALPLLR